MVELSEEQLEVLRTYLETKAAFEQAEKEYKKVVAKPIKEELRKVDMPPDAKTISLQVTEDVSFVYSPPKQYYRFKKGINNDTVRYEHPEWFDEKVGYETIRVNVRKE